MDADKEYVATIKLGEITTTFDSEGDIIHKSIVDVTEVQIAQAVQSFCGEITQVPPIYSALKVNGKPLYAYARSNEEVIIKSRTITIHRIEILEFVTHEVFKIKVSCSKGTYIRSLAHDIGTVLGCGAHLLGLIRTKTSGFELNSATNLDELKAYDNLTLQSLLYPVDTLVSHLLKVNLSNPEFEEIKNGHSFKYNNCLKNESIVRLYFQDVFLGIAKSSDGYIKPIRLMNTSTIKL